MWESWIRNKVVGAIAVFTGFEVAAWFVSKLAPPSQTFMVFFGASLSALTILAVYLLVSRRAAPSVAGTAHASPDSGTARGWSQATNSSLFPDLQQDELTENSVYLVLNHESVDAQNGNWEPFFRDGIDPIRLGRKLSSVPWAALRSEERR